MTLGKFLHSLFPKAVSAVFLVQNQEMENITLKWTDESSSVNLEFTPKQNSGGYILFSFASLIFKSKYQKHLLFPYIHTHFF